MEGESFLERHEDEIVAAARAVKKNDRGGDGRAWRSYAAASGLTFEAHAELWLEEFGGERVVVRRGEEAVFEFVYWRDESCRAWTEFLRPAEALAQWHGHAPSFSRAIAEYAYAKAEMAKAEAAKREREAEEKARGRARRKPWRARK